MLFRIMGYCYKKEYRNPILGVNLLEYTPEENYNAIINNCAYHNDEIINEIDNLFEKIIPLNKKGEYDTINLDFKMDSLILNGKLYSNLEYVYNNDSKCGLIIIKDLKLIQHNEKNLIAAKTCLLAINKLIRKRNEKIKLKK